MSFIEHRQQLDEVLITFGGKAYPKFNNVVLMAGGAGCFDSDTLVNTELGYKKISDITIDDKVFTYNEKTGQTEFKEVINTFKYEHSDDELLELEFDNGQIITCTSNHEFYINNEWVKAKDITVENN